MCTYVLVLYTVCYFTGIFYAVVRQISMLFIDNKDSVLIGDCDWAVPLIELCPLLSCATGVAYYWWEEPCQRASLQRSADYRVRHACRDSELRHIYFNGVCCVGQNVLCDLSKKCFVSK